MVDEEVPETNAPLRYGANAAGPEKAAENRLERREKFFSLVSHDLRSPLAVARICADLIIRKPEEAVAMAVRIADALKRADGMIRDFLDASHLESGRGFTLKPQECDIWETVKQASEEHSLLNPGRCECKGSGPVKGNWDANAIRRSLDNLIANALKYGDPATPVLIQLEASAQEVKISVHNSGQCIPAEDIPSLFQWHTRCPTAEKSGLSGWGLGLMLVKAVADAHGGRVQVESTPLAGTTFSLTLPRRTSLHRPAPE